MTEIPDIPTTYQVTGLGLVETLRDHAEPRDRPHGPAISSDRHFYGQAHIAVSVLLEAADEIEDLRRGVQAIRAAIKTPPGGNPSVDVAFIVSTCDALVPKEMPLLDSPQDKQGG